MFSDSDAEAPEEIIFDKEEAHTSRLESSYPAVSSIKTIKAKIRNSTFDSQPDFVSLTQENPPVLSLKKSKIKLLKHSLSQSELKSLKSLKQSVTYKSAERRNGALVMRT